MVKIIQMSIIFIAAVSGNDEDIPIKLGITFLWLCWPRGQDLQGGERQEDGEVDLHYHVDIVVRVGDHHLTVISNIVTSFGQRHMERIHSKENML